MIIPLRLSRESRAALVQYSEPKKFTAMILS